MGGQEEVRCHDCFETENLQRCAGNDDGPCKRSNVMCFKHASVSNGKFQCIECYKHVRDFPRRIMRLLISPKGGFRS
jgi:hypothetical protein